jgi:hypothetical protein
MLMKTTLILFISILFICDFSHGQKDSTHIKLYKYDSSREKLVKRETYLTVLLDDDKIIYNGKLIDKTDSFLLITYDYYQEKIKTDSTETFKSYRRIDEKEAPIVKIKLDDINYVSKESNTGLVFAGMGGLSLITSLIVAPLVSYSFRTGEFNSDRYLNIMKFSLPATALGFTFYYTFGNKKYSVRPMN